MPLFLALLTEDEEFDEDTAMMMMLLAMHEEEEQQRHRDAPLDDDEREPRVRLGYEALCAKYSCHAFKLHFRFDKEDIPRLAKALEMPVIKCPVTGARAEPCDALLYVLKRHAYPIRWVDMDAFFGRAVSTLAGTRIQWNQTNRKRTGRSGCTARRSSKHGVNDNSTGRKT